MEKLIFALGFILGFVQLVVGYIGIEEHLGTIVAVLSVILFFFHFGFPIIIGSFFGGLVLGWHWSLALLLAAGGIIVTYTVVGIVKLMERKDV